MINAAGILIATKSKEALFLLRGAGGDFPGCWALPGGKIEDGETALEAAKRETVEEIGFLPKGKPVELCRSQAIASGTSPDGSDLPGQAGPGETVDFTTFLLRAEEKFEPEVSGEHVGFAWAPLDQPPQPLHPGVQIALDRLSMTELDAARAIADGRLTSPQRFANMALFAMRISGTGLAYRKGRDEYVWRKPEEYLTEEMQARWLGAPVVWEHPESDTLTSKDFSDRVVGGIMLTFVKGDELWCVARIYDDAAIQILSEGGMSTSPGVVIKADEMANVKLEDGSNLLVEGAPNLTDHLAICQLGVWDKGGPATGVAAEARKDSAMTEEELKARKDADDKEKEEAERADKARKDADDKLSAIADAVGSLAKRMDAWEEEKKADKARKDAEEKEAEEKAKADAEACEAEEKAKADKAKKDAEEEEEKKRADAAAKADADLASRLAAVESRLPRALTDAEVALFADAQSRADSVMAAFGKQAPRPLDGESLLGYRRRLANMLKEHSPDCKDANLAAIADDTAFGIIETRIYKDALEAAKNPVDMQEGELRPIHRTDAAGRRITEWVGKGTFVRQFAAPVQRVTDISARH